MIVLSTGTQLSSIQFKPNNILTGFGHFNAEGDDNQMIYNTPLNFQLKLPHLMLRKPSQGAQIGFDIENF